MTALAEPDTTAAAADRRTDGSSGSSMIVFEDVRKVYEPNTSTALDGVSFTIDKGEFVFVVGASGSGKSTVIRLLLKEVEPTAGRIIVGGRDLGRLKGSKVPLLRRNLGCVFQDFKLLPNRTAAENIGYALRVQGESSAQIRKKVPEVLNLVGLAHKMNSRPEELSGGEQQRVSIARAFVNHPPLLVCDEPTGNLDPDTSVGIMQLLYRINRTGTTILMVTHDREMVDKMRKRVIALEEGKLVRDERRGGYAERMTRVRAPLLRGGPLDRREHVDDRRRGVSVLIGMFLLGVFIGLGTWLVSWSDDEEEGARRARLLRRTARRTKQINQLRVHLESDPRVKPAASRSSRRSRRSTIMQKRYPELTANLASNPLPGLVRRRPEARRGHGGDRARRPEGEACRRRRGALRQGGLEAHPRRSRAAIQIVFLIAVDHPARRVDDPHREHDPALDLRAPARDRGDEARRRDELVRARPVHARGPAHWASRARSPR